MVVDFIFFVFLEMARLVVSLLGIIDLALLGSASSTSSSVSLRSAAISLKWLTAYVCV